MGSSLAHPSIGFDLLINKETEKPTDRKHNLNGGDHN